MEIGPYPFIIAEISGNHGGNLSTALDMIAAAKSCGCDAVKIQLYEPEDLCDPANNELYEKCKIPRHWLPSLFGAAKQQDIILFSSVFAPWAVELLEKFDCPAYKLASPESTRLPEIEYMRLGGVIRNTGKLFMTSAGRRDMLVMNMLQPDVRFYCKAGYPATITNEDIEFAVNVGADGFSDHTKDIIAPLAMISAGICMIEKHFKLNDDCIDAAFSFNPEQMETLCRIAHR